MGEKELVELLSVHADGLREDLDLSAEMLSAEAEEDRSLLAALFALARRGQAALQMVEPRPGFVRDLHAQLSDRARQARAAAARHRAENRRRVIWLAAGLGGIVYFVGMAVVSVRLSLATVSFLAGLLGWRVAQSSVPKTRVAH